MLRKLSFALAISLALAACGNIQVFVPDTARLAPGALGSNGDPDVAAATLAQWAFSDAGRTYGRPIEAARAVAAIDYLAGQIYTSPRWAGVNVITKEQLLQARDEVRAAVGVAPGTTSQQVVNTMISAANALAAGDQAGALKFLGAPVYPAGPEKTLATLSNLPYLRMANIASQRLGNQLFDSDADIRF